MTDPEFWDKYMKASLDAAKFEGTLIGLLERLKRGKAILPNDGFIIKQIEDILTPQEYNVKM